MPTENFARVDPRMMSASTAVQAQPSLVTIAEFSLEMTGSIPTILAEYPLENTVPVNIRRPMEDHVQINQTFALAVRFENSIGDTIRYILHRPDDVDGLLYPSYGGETISEDSAVIEIWGVPAEATAASTDTITLTLGLTTFVQGGQIYACGQVAQTTTALTATEFVAEAFGPDNPFADAMMLAAGR